MSLRHPVVASADLHFVGLASSWPLDRLPICMRPICMRDNVMSKTFSFIFQVDHAILSKSYGKSGIIGES